MKVTELLPLLMFSFPLRSCTTIDRYPIFSTRYSVMCNVYTGYSGTSEIEHGLCGCTVDNPLAKARGLSLRTGAQTMLYLSHTWLNVLSGETVNGAEKNAPWNILTLI